MPDPGDLAIQRDTVGADVELVVNAPGAGPRLRALQPGGTMAVVGSSPSNRSLACSALIALARRRQGVQCSSTDDFRRVRALVEQLRVDIDGLAGVHPLTEAPSFFEAFANGQTPAMKAVLDP
ncbi:MAG: hypothetical protein ACTHQE_02705 [Thermomicrobiales bacterium]